jgi:hypothetical protein
MATGLKTFLGGCASHRQSRLATGCKELCISALLGDVETFVLCRVCVAGGAAAAGSADSAITSGWQEGQQLLAVLTVLSRLGGRRGRSCWQC